MKRDIAIISFLLLMIIVVLVDRISLQTEILKLGHAIDSLEKSNRSLENTIAGQNQKIEELQQLLQKKAFNDTDFGYWIASTFAVVFLMGILFLIILRTRLTSIKATITDRLTSQINEAKESLAAEIIQSGSILKKRIEANLRHAAPSSPADHTLPLKVGLEIHRMQKRIENMPTDTKGIRALKNSLKRLEVSFNDKGYEMTDLLGKPFSEGMTVHARFVPSDELNPGEQIITKVITPQINFEGVLIQVAEVEVNVGDSD